MCILVQAVKTGCHKGSIYAEGFSGSDKDSPRVWSGGKMAASLWLSCSGGRGMINLLLGRNVVRGALASLPHAVGWKFLHKSGELLGECLAGYI